MLSFVAMLALAQSPSLVSQFNDVCVKNYPKADAVKAHAKKAGWKDSKQTDRSPGNWSHDFEISRTRKLKLHSDDNRVYCSLSFGEEGVDARTLTAAVEKELGARRDATVEDDWNKVGTSGTGNTALVWRLPNTRKTIVSALVDKEGKALDLLIGHPFFVGAQE